MNWNTIYITGNENFWDDVNKKLAHSELKFLTGYIEKRPDGKFHGLYWLDNQVTLRQFKEAISGKVVWKYRLQFFNELEQTKNSDSITLPSTNFSDKENALIKSMRNRSAIGA